MQDPARKKNSISEIQLANVELNETPTTCTEDLNFNG